MRGHLILPAIAAMLASPAAAEKLEAQAMLVASTPLKDSTVEAGVDTITLIFAEPATVLSVSVRLPDDTTVDAEQTDPVRRGGEIELRYRLPAPLAQPGSYTISYLLTSRTFKSLNGFIDFHIAENAEPGPAAQEAAE